MATDKHERGMQIRREVLGDDYVDNALASASEFTMPLQDLLARNCWAEVWDRDGLSKKTRSLITIAMLSALKASSELKTHVRGALRNGCSVVEIQEVLLHSAVYCGAPTGIDSFRAAKDVIDEWQRENS